MFYFWVFLALFLVVLVVAVVPAWPYSRRWGYTPTAVALIVLLGFFALTYIGLIGPWRQEGPPYVEHKVPAPATPPGPSETPPAASQ
jgi:hypothetical protein